MDRSRNEQANMTSKELLLSELCAGIFVLSNIGVKLSVSPGRSWIMLPVFGGACLAYWLARRICLTSGLTVMGAVLDSLITVFTIAAGVFLFQEQLSFRQYTGILLLLLGLLLVR